MLKLGDDYIVPKIPTPIYNYIDKDTTSYIVAGFTTGIFFKSTVGIRGAIAAGIVGSLLSPVYLHGTSALNNFLHRNDAKF